MCFQIFNYIICTLTMLICLLPLLHIVAMSFSNKNAIISGTVNFFPIGFTLDNFRYVTKDAQFFTSFFVSVERVVLALAIQMSMTILIAYPLSRPESRFTARKFYVWFFLITMLFSGGLVPTYLIVSKTRLLNTIWALVVPGVTNVWYAIIMMNFMRQLPESLWESAALDGAGQFTILIRIILPLSKASIATIALFTAVDHWNDWFSGMLYINDLSKFPLQTYLQSIVVMPDINQLSDPSDLAKLVDAKGTNTAKIVLAMIPIMLVYPFIQKYFVTGVVIGSVKE